MYLSQLRLNPDSAAVRRDLADPYQMHRTLARVFAPDAEASPARFLWRLEHGRPVDDWGLLLVQAATPGRWGVLSAVDGYLRSLHADKLVDTDRLVHPGRRYRFRLRANPVVTRQGKRWGLHSADEQLAWLARQGLRHGFEVHGADISGRERIAVTQPRSQSRITLDSALFDGVLVAQDAVALRNALMCGIGPAKSFGLGLLSLAPL